MIPDPAGSDFLEQQNALTNYASLVEGAFRDAIRRHKKSLFVDFNKVASPMEATVDWIAFPRDKSDSTFDDIDNDRMGNQEEYVEWQVFRSNGQITHITYTTEFSEFYTALAMSGEQALVNGIRRYYQNATPTTTELFGVPDVSATTAERRANLFLDQLLQNPWINGTKGILCLAHGSNTLGALLHLIAACAIVNNNLRPDAVCASVGNFCVSGRNSDPSVCQAVQLQARQGKKISMSPPHRVKITSLDGIWKKNGVQVDMNSSPQLWSVTENGRRAVLTVTPDLTVEDNPITHGAQVAQLLTVGATIIVE